MSVAKNLIITSVILIGVAVVFQNFLPDLHSILLQLPYVQTLGSSIHKFFAVSATTKVPRDSKSQKAKSTRLYTAAQLSLYDGKPESKGLYLAILGQVFNVKKGTSHYGPDGGYSFFTGKDGSRAFVSGDFSEDGLIDDITGLNSQDYIGLDEWLKFYHNDYKFVGKLIGRYYDEEGKPTEYNLQVQQWTESAFAEKEDDNKEKKMFPPCNSEWYPETGTRVWCTKKSGGIDRVWVGVPRQLYHPGRQKARCACVKNFGPPSHDPSKPDHNNKGDLEFPKLEEYEGCNPTSDACEVLKKN